MADQISSKSLAVEIPDPADRLLGHLVERGLWGANKEEVVRTLLLAGLRDVVERGFVGFTGFPDGRTEPLVRPR
jgi:hypothetical protein